MEPLIFSNIIKKIIEFIGISECGKTNQRVYGHQIWTFVARSRRRGIWPRDNSRVPQPALHVFRRQHGSLRLEVLLIQLFYKTINICHLYLCEFVLYLHFIISWTKMFVLHFTCSNPARSAALQGIKSSGRLKSFVLLPSIAIINL
jgi:hypothetical protein